MGTGVRFPISSQHSHAFHSARGSFPSSPRSWQSIFGYAKGREDAMATLIGYFLGEAEQLGRAQLMVPLDFLPELAKRLAAHEPVTETRALHWQVDFQLAAKGLELELTRPYTDLSYW